MPTLVDMTSSVGDEPFSRIVESRKTTSWSIGVPIAIVVVVAVALLAYFAAKATQAREQQAQAQQALQQQQQQLTQLQQRSGVLEAELNQLRDPGRTAVILQIRRERKARQRCQHRLGRGDLGRAAGRKVVDAPRRLRPRAAASPQK